MSNLVHIRQIFTTPPAQLGLKSISTSIYHSSRHNINVNVNVNVNARQILTTPPAQRGLTRQVFVLTDGQVSNSSACISMVSAYNLTTTPQLQSQSQPDHITTKRPPQVRAHNDNARVFSLGVGSAADRHLVKGLARAGQVTEWRICCRIYIDAN